MINKLWKSGDLLSHYLNFDPVKKINGLELERSYENAGCLNIPLLIAGVMSKWKAAAVWSIDYLEEKLGDSEVIVSEQKHTSLSYFKAPLTSFIKLIRKERTDAAYYAHFSNHLNTDMVLDYDRPTWSNCWYKLLPRHEQKLVLSWIYMGTKNSFSPLHVDIHNTSAWNAVFMGRKLWLFYSPEQLEYLYNGEVNPFEPDLNKYPKFSYATPLVCIQEPGEVVYTPSGWWHCVLNLEKGFALTENFINESNYEYVKNDLLSVGAFKAVEKLQLLRPSVVQLSK